MGQEKVTIEITAPDEEISDAQIAVTLYISDPGKGSPHDMTFAGCRL